MTTATASKTEANRQTIREAFERYRQGTAPITDVFADKMTWQIEGHSAVSGQYASRQQFIDDVLDPLNARFAAGEPMRPSSIRAVYADADTVIVVWDGRGIANDGEPYENGYAWIMKMSDGKVVDGTAFFDKSSLDDLWTRVKPL